jgi:hypothetical protein
MPGYDPLAYATPEVLADLQRRLGYDDSDEARKLKVAALRGDPAQLEATRNLGIAGMALRGPTAERLSRTLYGQGSRGLDEYRDAMEKSDAEAERHKASVLPLALQLGGQQREDEWKNRQYGLEKSRLGMEQQRLGMERERLGQDAYAAIADPISGEIILYNKKTGERVGLGGQAAGAPAAPQGGPRRPGFDPALSGQVKMNETQDKSHYFAQLMADNLPSIAKAAQGGYKPSQMDLSAAGPPRPGFAGLVQQNTPRGFASEEGRNFYTAGRQVLAAILRKESGAAITDDEWQNYGPMYLPWPGDSPQQQQQKIMHLYELADTMAQGAGPAARYWTPLERPSFAGPRADGVPAGEYDYVNGQLVPRK